MPWIDKNTEQPLKEGYYKCLVDVDSMGTLVEHDNQYFNGINWDWSKSCAQFITHWYSDKTTYDLFFEKWSHECLEECKKSLEPGYLD